MRKTFVEYLSANQTIYFHHTLDEKENGVLSYKAESHPHYELLYLIKGDLAYTTGGYTYQVSPGDFLILNVRELHKLTINLHTDYERYVLQFSPLAVSIKDQDMERIFQEFLLSGHSPLHIFAKKDVDQTNVVALMQEIEANCVRNDTFTLYRVNALILELAAAVSELHKLSRKRKGETADLQVNDHIKKVVSYISDHITENITINGIARDLYLNPYYISHLFTKTMGISLKKYVTTMKIFRAEELINEGKPATQVSEMLGFTYYSTFFNAYKTILRKTPSTDKTFLTPPTVGLP